METYSCLQHYWWFLISLLGGLLVFLLFVQGGNSLLFQLGKTAEERSLLINATGRKWEFTFTTLVTFGGAFFASFPLFYSTSFGGAYWAWMLILFSFVLQAVAYEFQASMASPKGKKVWQSFLVFNGILGPLLLGAAVATFFTGSNFVVDKGNMSDLSMPVISRWANGWHGIDILFNIWNWVLGIAVYYLSRVLGGLYFLNRIDDDTLVDRCRRRLFGDALAFLVFFLAFVVRTLVSDGFAVNPATQEIYMEPLKYLNNLLAMHIVKGGGELRRNLTSQRLRQAAIVNQAFKCATVNIFHYYDITQPLDCFHAYSAADVVMVELQAYLELFSQSRAVSRNI